VARRRDDQVLYVCPSTATPPERVLALTGGERVVMMMPKL
jgi:hypothetical protein